MSYRDLAEHAVALFGPRPTSSSPRPCAGRPGGAPATSWRTSCTTRSVRPEPLWRPVLDGAVAFLAAVGHDPGPGADDAYERLRELFSRRDVPGAFFS